MPTPPVPARLGNLQRPAAWPRPRHDTQEQRDFGAKAEDGILLHFSGLTLEGEQKVEF